MHRWHRIASDAAAKPSIITVEITKSKDEAKKLFDQSVATKQNAGYVYNPTATEKWKANHKGKLAEVWVGNDYNGHSFLCAYEQFYFSSSYSTAWGVVTEATGDM